MTNVNHEDSFQSNFDKAKGKEKKSPRRRMDLVEALRVLVNVRKEQIVVSSMGSAREWPKLSAHPLDFQYLPSAMGQAPTLGLGIALARADREVIVLNGDGSMLMNLGALVTVAASGVKNYTLCVLDNGLYEVTGGQETAAVEAGTDFTELARGSGFPAVYSFDDCSTWQLWISEVLQRPGPRFIHLRVAPVRDYALPMAASLPQRALKLREHLIQ